MSRVSAIEIESLGKEYLLGGAEQYSATFREMLSDAVTAPFRKLRRLSGRDEEQERIWALKDVSFQVQPGEVVGIIGRNGAGKSTLLKILSRITEPTEGRVITRGRVSSLLEVGTGFHPELTGRENIFLNGAILGMRRSEIQSKFDDIVAFAEVEKFIDTPVKRYSSGMYVRLAFAVAAHLEPEILVVDEVLAVGDAQFQKKCLGKMGDVAKEGRTVLFVSHNMTAVKSLCPRAVLLQEGRLAVDGETESVVDQYIAAGQYVANRQSWQSVATAPGNEYVRIKSVSAINAGDEDRPISVSSPVDVRIELWNLKPGMRNISLSVKGVGGNIVFASPSRPTECAPGVYRFECRIPPNLLNDGLYALMVLVVETGRVLFSLDDSVMFEVIDEKRDGAWMGKWPGVVRPKLDWRMEQLGA